LERWFSEHGDVRSDPDTLVAVTEFIRAHGATSVVMPDVIIGC